MFISGHTEKVGAGLVRALLTINCEAGYLRNAVVVDVGDGHGDGLFRIGGHVVCAAPCGLLVDGGV